MKRALIVIETNSLCDIVEAGAEFPVAPGLLWVDAPDNVSHDTHEFNGAVIVEKPVVPPSAEQVVSALTAVMQRHLDDTASARGYDGILSLCSYATSTHPRFGAEGQAGVAWRDAVWGACYAVMADVQQGLRPVPTKAELLAELPSITWPA